MIPYVRKSFGKHYKKGLKYLSDIEENNIDYEIEAMLKDITNYSIEDTEWKFYNPKAYQYAIDMTINETHQAAEGLFHNLNTL